MGDLRPWHLIVLAVVMFVLFGYKKLPDATRSLGRSLRILKTEVKTLHDDETEIVVTAPAVQPASPAPTAAPKVRPAVAAPRADANSPVA
ncbi:MAG: sec-independent translocation protein [Mycobacterium sp.]|jgi:sec-independent protein translocase protein TatA|nr:sec-independent translocation protein [Mycobacterium sp.]